MRSAAFALLALSTPAYAAGQFDLQCSGSVYSVGPTSRHYRVDVKAGKWCADGDNGQCIAQAIAKIEPDMIWFERRDAQYWGDVVIVHYVSRTTGHWYWRLGSMETEGTCSPAPFSGFPKFETKF